MNIACKKCDIHKLLDDSDNAVVKAVVLVYQSQTYEERTGYICTEVNGVGFNKYDVKYLTGVAHVIKRKHKLTPTQIKKSRERIKKYWRQLFYLPYLLINKEAFKYKSCLDIGKSYRGFEVYHQSSFSFIEGGAVLGRKL